MFSYISSLNKARDLAVGQRKLSVLGSTGSIGQNVLRVVSGHPEDFALVGLAGARNLKVLASQAATWRPRVIGVKSEDLIAECKALLPRDYRPEIVSGVSGYQYLASLAEADIVVSAQLGAAGLAPTLKAVQSGKIVALANKESLVLAGPLIKKMCAASEAAILPVDSEHNAMFQCLAGHEGSEASKLILTASGGPFRGKDKDFLRRVTLEQALNHPSWSMGAKISIDSSTLMNKGLELIEAHYLFGLGLDRIQVIIHPESLIHSMVEYQDGSILAHMGIPDMRIPIAFCLSYPRRLSLGLKPLDFIEHGSLSFFAPQDEEFPCLRLAQEALQAGPSYPVVLNAANEVAVALFLEKKIGFQDIAAMNAGSLDAHQPVPVESLEDILALDRETRARLDPQKAAGVFA